MITNDDFIVDPKDRMELQKELKKVTQKYITKARDLQKEILGINNNNKKGLFNKK